MSEKRLVVKYWVYILVAFMNGDTVEVKVNPIIKVNSEDEGKQWILQNGVEYAEYIILPTYEKTEDRIVRQVRKRKSSKSDSQPGETM